MDILGKSTCDSWAQQATSRCLHTTGCSSAVQQVLQDGKLQKTQKFKDFCTAGTGACSFPGMVCGKQGAKGFPGTFSSQCCSWQTPYDWLYEQGGLLRV